jgi:hypothetical protein
VDASDETNDRIDEMFDTFSVEAGHREDYFATHQKRKTYENVGRGNFESMCFHFHTAFALLQDYLWRHPKESVGWVVKTRPDISPLTPVPLPDVPQPDLIHYLRSHQHYDELPQGWLPDQYDAGDFESMQRFCAVFDYMFVNSGDMPARGHTGVMEHELGIFVLERWNLKMTPIDCDYDFYYR